MERVQCRRRVNADPTQENDPQATRAAVKSVANPKPTLRTAFGDVGNQPGRLVLAAKTNALKTATGATKIPATKPAVSVRSVFGVVNQKKDGLLKPSVLKKQPAATLDPPKPAVAKAVSSSQLPPAKWQIKKQALADEVKSILPTVPTIKHKDIAKAFHSGQVIKRHTSESDTEVLKGIYDVDLEDDPQLVSEYINDIMKHLLQLEDAYPIEKNYLKDQKLTEKHRAVLINWLVDVADSFKYLKETLHLSVAIVDRYLCNNRAITHQTLQLVGMAAMFIANKYEEMVNNPIEDWEYICDETYTRAEIFRMECDMLSRLNFCLGRPTAITFLRRFSKVVCATARQHVLGKYLIELALMEYEFCSVKPSVQAAAACCLSRWLTQVEGGKPKQAWNDLLAHYSGYQYADIRGTVARFAAMLVRAETSKYKNIRKLYAEPKQQRISMDEALRCVKLKVFAAAANATT